MRIDELTLTNFKCFENKTFRFNPHFNIVIGRNGSGKTSLLDAAALAVNTYLQGIDDNLVLYMKPEDTRTLFINGQPKPQLPVKITGRGAIHNNEVSFHPDLIRKPQGNRYQSYSYAGGSLLDYAMQDVLNSRKNENSVTFPLIAYYKTNRMGIVNDSAHFTMQQEGIFSAYSDCLSANSSSELFLSWYKTIEDTVAKFKQDEQILQLNLFRKTISSMIPEWTDMAFNYLANDLMGIFKDENGSINMLPFKSLSDGYRNVIGMVADMVYRCIQLNPGLKERAVTDTNGVVFIDEICLHLHPEWQKTIVGDLKKIFPKIQFIATTHSPFIVQSLSKDELIILDEDVTTGKDPWRQSIEEIAADEMQVSDVRRSELFNEREAIAKGYFTLVKQNDTKDSLRTKIDEAKKQLDKLTIEFSDDPAYVAMLKAQLEKAEHHAAGI
jgi:predicted ATP-binding protein involved in virulence